MSCPVGAQGFAPLFLDCNYTSYTMNFRNLLNSAPWLKNLRKPRKSLTKFMGKVLLGLSVVFIIWFGINWWHLHKAATGKVDAFLVLGGGIYREIYAAQVAIANPTIPILISQGSADPCIWMMFQLQHAPMEKVWLEKCARSTFDNFYFSRPILQRWGVKKVQLITSISHTPRALWMAKILLGSQGIWVEPDIIPDVVIPEHKEEAWKTAIDVSRSLGLAVLSQFFSPSCEQVIPLTEVKFTEWQEMGFKCERRKNAI